MTALNAHITALNASQLDVRVQLTALIAGGADMPTLKYFNLGDAPVTDGLAATPRNLTQFNNLFETDSNKKKRIMAEIVNASRPGFTWNRSVSVAALTALFLPAMNQRLRSTAGNEGTFLV